MRGDWAAELTMAAEQSRSWQSRASAAQDAAYRLALTIAQTGEPEAGWGSVQSAQEAHRDQFRRCELAAARWREAEAAYVRALSEPDDERSRRLAALAASHQHAAQQLTDALEVT
ncbi:hypothetical protein [Kitasatospora sp. NPDC093679]|uniref:hypothetical protein n=1 Tax=Kitasatospora sp. NPDC093679 TaxID=3154983 RepID=UPI0034472CC6